MLGQFIVGTATVNHKWLYVQFVECVTYRFFDFHLSPRQVAKTGVIFVPTLFDIISGIERDNSSRTMEILYIQSLQRLQCIIINKQGPKNGALQRVGRKLPYHANS